MKINKSKTKVLVCTKKEQTRQGFIKINHENLDGVKEFRYLGSKVIWGGRSENEIKSRIAQAKMGFNLKQKLLCSSSISLENRKMLLKTYIWSIAMFGCETWTIWEAERKRLEAFERWCYRRMMNIKWWIELQMKFLEESEKEAPCGWVWRREEVRWWGTHWVTGDFLEISWKGRWERKGEGESPD